jgi:hypothetical protein
VEGMKTGIMFKMNARDVKPKIVYEIYFVVGSTWLYNFRTYIRYINNKTAMPVDN